MADEINTVRREIAPGVDISITGEGVQQGDVVLAHVLIELAFEAGGQLKVNMSDPVMVEKIFQRLRLKGINPETGEWLH